MSLLVTKYLSSKAVTARGWSAQVYGGLGGMPITLGLGDLLFRGVHVTGFW